MAPKTAVSKSLAGRKRPGQPDSSAEPSTSRPRRSRPGDEPSDAQPTNEAPQEPSQPTGPGHFPPFKLSTLPEEVDGRRVPKAKFAPRDLPDYYFGAEGRKFQFYTTMLGRPVHVPRKIDFEFLGRCDSDIKSMLSFQGWLDLLDYEAPVYNELALIFFFNWNPREYNSHVKGTEISFGGHFLSPEDHLGQILGVEAIDEELEMRGEDVMNALCGIDNKYTSAHRFMKAKDMSIELRMLRKVMEAMIVPKLGSTEILTVHEATVLYKIYHYKRVSLPHLIMNSFSYLSIRGDTIIPYGMWLTKVFQQFDISLDGESQLSMPPLRRDWVGETLLKRMGCTEQQYKEEMTLLREEEESSEDSASRGQEGVGEESGERVGDPEEQELGEGRGVDVGGIPRRDRPTSSTVPEPAVPFPRSSAYAKLSGEVEQLKAGLSGVKSSLSHMQMQLDLLLRHFGIAVPAQPTSPLHPGPSGDPVSTPPVAGPVAAPQDPTEGESASAEHPDPAAGASTTSVGTDPTFTLQELISTEAREPEEASRDPAHTLPSEPAIEP